jgi:hypothetical protein
MQSGDLLKMKVGSVVYENFKVQFDRDPCTTSFEGIRVNYPTYESREVIREGVRACPCEGGGPPCYNALPPASAPGGG